MVIALACGALTGTYAASLTRGTERFANTVGAWLFMRVMEPAAFIMTRRMLLGLKEPAEALSAARVHDDRGNRRTAA
jgi:hypothetical protein